MKAKYPLLLESLNRNKEKLDIEKNIFTRWCELLQLDTNAIKRIIQEKMW